MNPNTNTGHIKTTMFCYGPDVQRHTDVISIAWDGDYTSVIQSTIEGHLKVNYHIYDTDSNDILGFQFGPFKYDQINNSDLFSLEDNGVAMKINLPLDYYTDKSGQSYISRENYYKLEYYIVTLEADFILDNYPDFTWFSNHEYGGSYVHISNNVNIDMSIDGSISISGPSAGISFDPDLKINEHIIEDNLQFLIDPTIRNYPS